LIAGLLHVLVQVVGYQTPDAGLYVAEGGDVRFEPLEPTREIDWSLGERHCAGTIHDDEHISCDTADAPYCEAHQSTWVCARCTGTCLKDEMDCHDDHAIYLAAFAPDIFKVGVTKAWRLDTRLREQGADRAAHIRTVENGRIAREIESELAENLTDRVRVPTKTAGLHQSVDGRAWHSLLDDFDPVETFSFDYDLALSEQPVAETLASGTVLGSQGRVVVVENAGSNYAVDLRQLVGYELESDGTDPELQSSLGAFG
jgi:hypothetical protein